MKISRLDKIVADNVGFSEKFSDTKQMIYVLQDISETLAMIYDKMCKDKGDKEWEN